MLSNEHVVPSQAVLDSLEALFNFEADRCDASTDSPWELYPGDALLKVNDSLDYSLFTLGGRPAALYDSLPLASTPAAAGDRIYIPQHPHGNPKTVAVFEDRASDGLCRVDTVDSSDLHFECDTEGGASGSPIIDWNTHTVVGINRAEHVFYCDNLGVRVDRVLADLGPLLPTCSTKEFYSVADSFTHSGNRDVNFNYRDDLLVGWSSFDGHNGQARGWIRFDISTLPTWASIQTAQLRLAAGSRVGSPPDVWNELRRGIAAWNETRITWSNQPPIGPIVSTFIAPSTMWMWQRADDH